MIAFVFAALAGIMLLLGAPVWTIGAAGFAMGIGVLCRRYYG